MMNRKKLDQLTGKEFVMANEKKIAFITGANRGLGKESARQLGKLGVVVVIGSRDAKKGEAVAAEFRSQGIAAESVRCDVHSAGGSPRGL